MTLARLPSRRVKFTIILTLLIFCGISLLSDFPSALKTNNQLSIETNALLRHRVSPHNPRQMPFTTFQYLIAYNKKKHSVHPLTQAHGSDMGVYFHWDDWVDFSAANSVLQAARRDHPSGGCSVKTRKFGAWYGFFWDSHDTKVARGMAELYCSYEIPKKLMMATDKSFVELPVLGKKRLGREHLRQEVTHDMLLLEMKQVESKQSKMNTKNLTPDEQKAQTEPQNTDFHNKFTYSNYKNLAKQRHVAYEQFVFNVNDEMIRLKEKWIIRHMWVSEKKYLDFLTYGNDLALANKPFFKEAAASVSSSAYGDVKFAHPFYNRQVGARERASIFHHMIRVWFQFTESNGYTNWLSDTSLLAWSTTGAALPNGPNPFAGVQMPIRVLDRLGRDYNRTLIVENPRYGNGKYYLEVAPTYVRSDPSSAKSNNKIDARFVDIDSGLYLEINALTVASLAQSPSSQPIPLSTLTRKVASESNDLLEYVPVTNQQQTQWHSLKDVVPLRHSYFEGASVYVPSNVTRHLQNDIVGGGLKSNFFGNAFTSNYNKQFTNANAATGCSKSPAMAEWFVDKNDYLLSDGPCDDPMVQDEYKITYEMAHRHAELNKDIDKNVEYDPVTLRDLPLFRKDRWDYYNDIHAKKVDHTNWFSRQELAS